MDIHSSVFETGVTRVNDVIFVLDNISAASSSSSSYLTYHSEYDEVRQLILLLRHNNRNANHILKISP